MDPRLEELLEEVSPASSPGYQETQTIMKMLVLGGWSRHL